MQPFMCAWHFHASTCRRSHTRYDAKTTIRARITTCTCINTGRHEQIVSISLVLVRKPQTSRRTLCTAICLTCHLHYPPNHRHCHHRRHSSQLCQAADPPVQPGLKLPDMRLINKAPDGSFQQLPGRDRLLQLCERREVPLWLGQHGHCARQLRQVQHRGS